VELLPPDDPWASYARTVVVIVRPDTTNIVVEGAAPGRTGAWPWPTDEAVHVITAWDPGNARPSLEQNRANQAALETELAGLGPKWLRDAVGVDPLSGHREEGLAVCGLGIDAVRDLGTRYRQDAVFEWTPPAWTILACRGRRRVDFGWSASSE
jgi:hypothetical protein